MSNGLTFIVEVVRIFFFSVLLFSNQSSIEASNEQNNEKRIKIKGISFKKYLLLMHSESAKEYYVEDVDYIWEAQTKFEWDHRRQKTQGSTKYNKSSPFILCYNDKTKTAMERHHTIERFFKTNKSIIPLIARPAENCYQVYTTVSKCELLSKTLQDSISIQPVSYAMKMLSGSVDLINDTTLEFPTKKEKIREMISFHVVACPNIQFPTIKSRDKMKQELIEYTQDTSKIKDKDFFWTAVSNETLKEYSNRANHWIHLLNNNNNSSQQCHDLFQEIHFSFHSIPYSKSFKLSTILMTLFSSSSSSSYDKSTIKNCMSRLLLSLSLQSSICSIQTRPKFYAMNQYAQWLVQTGVEAVTPFYDVGLNGSGVVIALSDTGIDLTHCYFEDKDNQITFGEPANLTFRKVIQYDDYVNKMDYQYGHGTHVAGSLAGLTASCNGMSKGIAHEAQLAFIDIGYQDGSLRVPDGERLLNTGSPYASVHSASWGSTYNGYGTNAWEFDTFATMNDELLLVVAAGNSGDGDTHNTVGDPATAKNVIAVGSSHSYDRDIKSSMKGPGYISSFSSRGPTLDGRTKPEIIAPGQYISSAAAYSHSCDADQTPKPNHAEGGLVSFAGTSMATPILSATAALIIQYLREGYYPSGEKRPEDEISNPSATLVKALILNGGQDMYGVDNGDNGITKVKTYDDTQNFGRVSLVDSLYLVNNSNVQVQLYDREKLQENEIKSFEMKIDMSGNCTNTIFTTTLTWNDPPSLPGCQDCLMHDLDLTVQKNNESKFYYPNGHSERDSHNTAERVRIFDVENGDDFTIFVTAAALLHPQSFSLVASGCFGGTGNDIDMSQTVFVEEDDDTNNYTSLILIIFFSIALLTGCFYYYKKRQKDDREYDGNNANTKPVRITKTTTTTTTTTSIKTNELTEPLLANDVGKTEINKEENILDQTSTSPLTEEMPSDEIDNNQESSPVVEETSSENDSI